MIRKLSCSFLSLLIMNFPAHAAMDDTAIKVKWGYIGNTGPTHWGGLNPDFAVCTRGKAQSPININKSAVKAKNELQISYQAAPLKIVEDGVTNLTIGNDQVVVNTGHGTQLNFSKQNAETITLAGNNYRLVQFHFHSPSEHTLHGQSFPLEIHFVHQNDRGEVAVIGVFVKGGEANPAIQKIIDHLPMDKGMEHVIQGESVNPNDLLPAKHGYYRYEGSLTTPPCVEGLQWVVMAEPITASYVQITQLRNAAGGVNARPVQLLNKRKVFYTHNT
ncbi:MAG: carbonic anhydrase family protein [Gammaproteobacteria bacterium]|nr:MAG: carbonic anhydrase family protein [Gammaproteobacteria bacterium]